MSRPRERQPPEKTPQGEITGAEPGEHHGTCEHSTWVVRVVCLGNSGSWWPGRYVSNVHLGARRADPVWRILATAGDVHGAQRGVADGRAGRSGVLVVPRAEDSAGQSGSRLDARCLSQRV